MAGFLGRLVPLYWVGFFNLSVSFLLRLVLFVAFGPPATVPLWHLPPVLGLGLIDDAIELLYLSVPFSLHLFLTHLSCLIGAVRTNVLPPSLLYMNHFPVSLSRNTVMASPAANPSHIFSRVTLSGWSAGAV